MGSRAAFSPYAQHVESLRYREGGAFVAVFHSVLMLLLPVFPSRFVGWFR